jgi:anti-sigma-K factor RskA
MSNDDLAMQAAEYALGTLEKTERADFARRLVADPAAQAMVRDWEGRLAPLSSVVPESAPDPSLLGRIEADIDARQSGANVVALRRSITRWRVSTAAVGAIAASLAVFAVVRAPLEETAAPPAQQVARSSAPNNTDRPSPAVAASVEVAKGDRTSGGVALANGDAGSRGGVAVESRSPSWIASLAPVGASAGLSAELDADGFLTVRRRSVEAPAGKDLALWLLAPDRAPKSLGVLTRETERLPIRAAMPDGAELAASFEPKQSGAPAAPSVPYAFRGRLVRQ